MINSVKNYCIVSIAEKEVILIIYHLYSSSHLTYNSNLILIKNVFIQAMQIGVHNNL